MHDLMFTKEIITELKNKLASSPKGTKIKAVNASLSPLCHVKPETLAETFNATIKGTEFESVRLSVKVLPLEIKCTSCGLRFNIDKPTIKCPKCSNTDLDILYSKEFSVDSIII